MSKTIGTCSLCSGRVSVPAVWMGTVPPVPKCESCGAVAKLSHGPVIDMQPISERRRQNFERLAEEILAREFPTPQQWRSKFKDGYR